MKLIVKLMSTNSFLYCSEYYWNTHRFRVCCSKHLNALNVFIMKFTDKLMSTYSFLYYCCQGQRRSRHQRPLITDNHLHRIQFCIGEVFLSTSEVFQYRPTQQIPVGLARHNKAAVTSHQAVHSRRQKGLHTYPLIKHAIHSLTLLPIWYLITSRFPERKRLTWPSCLLRKRIIPWGNCLCRLSGRHWLT